MLSVNPLSNANYKDIQHKILTELPSKIDFNSEDCDYLIVQDMINVFDKGIKGTNDFLQLLYQEYIINLQN